MTDKSFSELKVGDTVKSKNTGLSWLIIEKENEVHSIAGWEYKAIRVMTLMNPSEWDKVEEGR